ncbi:MAG: hypothetical protein Ct9H90mP18_03820 [Gammaproteobacteria bacterium]|nr:MAG: hypothetical protein Ct9H90mP18_03820 [Gammaproteobacteria bacterium]
MEQKFTYKSFPGDGPQKKLAASYSKKDWVLSLDADERLEEDLINHINSIDLALQDWKHILLDGEIFVEKNGLKLQVFIQIELPDYITSLRSIII